MLTIQLEKQLAHFNLKVAFTVKNEIVVLFGPSGSGKTTILHCIAGLAKADKGKIILGERVLFENGKVHIPAQQRNIGYIFQDYALFPHMTVWKNIAYAMKSERFARRLMMDLHIDHLKHHFPHEISGGEKQRVAIARALVTEPAL